MSVAPNYPVQVTCAAEDVCVILGQEERAIDVQDSSRKTDDSAKKAQ